MKQLLRPLRLLLPALLLGGFSSQAQNLNYTPATATNVAGTYTDLTTGTVISTNGNTDDANSAATPIGFNFSFNGATFSQFVLNTNGFIRLGSAAPSGTALYPSQVSATIVDPLTSTDPANVNLIMPFNQDLGPGNGGATEYRVSTSGTSPNQVCTIQWKNVSDKPDALPTASQYANFSFQVKLYETTNVVELVYSTATASTGTAGVRFPNVGIKGSGVANGQTVLAAKNASSALWSTATFITGSYGAFTLNYRANVGPDAGRTFRFAPAVLPNNDIAVTSVYSLGRVSSAYGSPVAVQAVVTNNSATTKTNIPVTLTVTGASTPTPNVQTVATLASGASATVTFTPFAITGTSGTNTLTVTVPSDDVATNNSATATQTITAAEHSYIQGTTYTGGVGLSAANNILAVRHNTTGAAVLTTVTPTFIGPTAGTTTAPSTYQVLVYSVASTGLPGTVLYTSPSRPRPTTTGATTPLPDPVTVPNIAVNGGFFVAIQVLSADNIGIGYQTESPLRPNTFFFSTTNGTSWVDLNTQSISPRLALDVTLASSTPTACAAVTGLTAGSVTNTGASIGFTGNSSATSYTVTYRPTSGGTTTTVTPNPTTSPVPLTGLTAGTNYTVTVTANCASGASTAVTTTFTTTGGTTTCAAVTGLAVPSSSITGTTATVTFNGISNATSYSVFYYPSSGGTNTFVTPNPTASPVSLTGLTPNTNYTVAVITNCASGSSSTSTAVSFTTGSPCPQVTNAAVNTNGSTTSGTLTFTPAIGAASYTATLSTGTTTGTPTTITGSPINLTNLTANTTYTVTIVTNCTGGGTSTPVTVTFTTSAGPANDNCSGATALTVGTTCVPTTTTNVNATASTGNPALPANGCFDPSLPITTDVWFSVVVPASGAVRVTTSAISGSSVNDTGLIIYSGTCGNLTQIACNDDINAPNNRLSSVVATAAAGSTIYARVFSYPTTSGTPTGQFGICAVSAAPTTCNPAALQATATTTTSANVGFTSSTGAAYQAFTRNLTTRVLVPVTPNPTSSPVALTSLDPATRYRFYLVTQCGNGSQRVDSVDFATPGEPITNNTTINVSSTGANVVFTAPAGATGYTVTYTVAGSSTPITVTGVTGSPIVLTGLQPNTSYTVTVVANYPNGITSAAVTTTFSTAVAAAREALGNGSLSVYPNPAHQAFTLTLPALSGVRTAQLTLLNSLGQQVQTRTIELNANGTQTQVNVAGLATGLYTVRVQAGPQVATQQVAVQ